VRRPVRAAARGVSELLALARVKFDAGLHYLTAVRYRANATAPGVSELLSTKRMWV
jgi:hypothetical protein